VNKLTFRFGYGATKLLTSISGAPCIEIHTNKAASIAAGTKRIAALAKVLFFDGRDCLAGSALKVDSVRHDYLLCSLDLRFLARNEWASATRMYG
jgi:hypothetical protein